MRRRLILRCLGTCAFMGTPALAQEPDPVTNLEYRVAYCLADLEDGDHAARQNAMSTLVSLEEAAVPILIRNLDPSSTPLRDEVAARALGEIGAPATAAIPTILERLVDADPNLERALAVSLAQIAPYAPALKQAVRNAVIQASPTPVFPNWSPLTEVPEHLARAYGRLHVDPLGTESDLAAALEHKDPFAREYAAELLLARPAIEDATVDALALAARRPHPNEVTWPTTDTAPTEEPRMRYEFHLDRRIQRSALAALQHHAPDDPRTRTAAATLGSDPWVVEYAGDPGDGPIRILYVEEAPRWEYRYVKNALVDADGFAVQAFLCDAAVDFPQEASPGMSPLRSLPRTAEELFGYDVILLGDVAPERLGRRPEERETWMRMLAAFVNQGGGVAFVAGRSAMPEGYRGTPITDLLPIELRATPTDFVQTPGFLAEPAMDHATTRLHRNADRNARTWEKLPPLASYYPAVARPDAEVLLVHSTARDEHGPPVIAAVRDQGLGKVFWIATDETWRWRMEYGQTHQEKFWHNVIRYLAP